ncbi:MAG TPA: FabA/FabZ family ACP-dehydratase [Puia sp.]|jgi:3-hydroxyacyl-[acyl-carrier-protein] dehydratase
MNAKMYQHILDKLPYKSSFRFVDTILSLDGKGVTGEYTLRPNAFFYEDHFVGNPVTPGVIVTEIMAQIGVVVLGIYYILNSPEYKGLEGENLFPLLTSTEVSFYRMVLPGEKLRVVSQQQYFRFGKLKCYIEALGEDNELVARGMFAGVIKKTDKKDN